VAVSGTVAHDLPGDQRLASMNFFVRSNGFGGQLKVSGRVADVPDALHHMEIMWYCAMTYCDQLIHFGDTLLS
jgi:hypothetical protein